MIDRTHEILRALAWAAPLRTDQVHRIVAPTMDRSNFYQRLLTPLAAQAMITCVTYQYAQGVGHRNPALRRPPRPLGKVWALSEQGWDTIRRFDAVPAAPALVRPSVLTHDLMTSEVITKIIEWTRPILSSIFLDHEVRLDESRRRPIADAMLVVRYHHAPERAAEGFVPWKSRPPQPGEGVRLYAIEMDRDTEESVIIHDKATNYGRVRSDPSFYQRYGGMFPTVLVVVPQQRRLQNWHAGWVRNWPTGTWLITTDADLQRDHWLHYRNGIERYSTFVDGWQPGHDVPPGHDAPTPLPVNGPRPPTIVRLPDW